MSPAAAPRKASLTPLCTPCSFHQLRYTLYRIRTGQASPSRKRSYHLYRGLSTTQDCLSATNMASASFRDSMNSLGWSRRDPDVPVNTSPPTFMGRIQNLNPFGSGGYVRLPTSEGPGAPLPAPTRREEEEGWFACKCTFYLRWQKPLSPCALHCLV